MKIIKITLSFSLFIFSLMANSNSLLSDYKSNTNANKDIQYPARVKMKSLFCYNSDKKDYFFEAATYDGRLYKLIIIEDTKFGGILDIVDIVDKELFEKTRNKFNLYGDTDYFVYEVLSGIWRSSRWYGDKDIKTSIEVGRHNNLFGVTTKGIQEFCSDCPESIEMEDVYDFSTSANYLTRTSNGVLNRSDRICKVSKEDFYIFNHFDSKQFETRESAKKFQSVSEKYKGAW